MDGAEQEGRAAAGFLLVLLAASCVVLGSSAVFHPSFARWATARVLGASLGFATGVMLYVSLVDIYSKSISAFEEHGHGKDVAFVFTTLAFFAGVAIMKVRVFVACFVLLERLHFSLCFTDILLFFSLPFFWLDA